MSTPAQVMASAADTVKMQRAGKVQGYAGPCGMKGYYRLREDSGCSGVRTVTTGLAGLTGSARRVVARTIAAVGRRSRGSQSRS